MVDLRGVEPLTSAMRMLRSSQLSYRPASEFCYNLRLLILFANFDFHKFFLFPAKYPWPSLAFCGAPIWPSANCLKWWAIVESNH